MKFVYQPIFCLFRTVTVCVYFNYTRVPRRHRGRHHMWDCIVRRGAKKVLVSNDVVVFLRWTNRQSWVICTHSTLVVRFSWGGERENPNVQGNQKGFFSGRRFCYTVFTIFKCLVMSRYVSNPYRLNLYTQFFLLPRSLIVHFFTVLTPAFYFVLNKINFHAICFLIDFRRWCFSRVYEK